MRYFPQLVTGAITQYPVRRSRHTRTVLSAGQDGDLVKLHDPDAELLEWELHLSGLTDYEWAAIESLFDACEGRLRTFCFLDPLDNLLAYSEDFAADVWHKDGMLQVTPGVSDPDGGTAASKLVNAGQTPQALSQALDVPANMHFCLSAYVRASTEGKIRLEQHSQNEVLARDFDVSRDWTRVRLSGNLQADQKGVNFRIVLPPGAAVELYGVQVEAQPASSAYKKTGSRGGIYPEARFADDELRLTSTGPNSHSTAVRIVTPVKSS